MSKYPFSQLIRETTSQAQGLLTNRIGYTVRKYNAEIVRSFLTEGGTTLADFFVSSPRSAVHSFVNKPRNQAQSRCLQLRKEGV